MDAVYLMALYHDIAKLREERSSQAGDRSEMFRNEIGPELGLPSKLIKTLHSCLTQTGSKGIKTKTSRKLEQLWSC